MKMTSQRTLGFTLIEILVATAITALLVVVLLSISQSMLASYQRIRDDSGSIRQADAVLDLMAADLEALYPLRLDPDAETLNASIDTTGGVEFPWVTIIANPLDSDPDSRSAPRAISYRMAYQNPVTGGSTSPRYCLHRTVLDAQTTFSAVPSPQAGLEDFWNARDARALDDFVGDGVVAKRFRIQLANGTWHETGSQSLRIIGGNVWMGGTDLGEKPVAIEITLGVLSDHGQRVVRSGAISLDDALQKFGRSISRIVPLRASHPE